MNGNKVSLSEMQLQNLDLPLVEILETQSPKLEGVAAVIPAHNEERFIGSVVLAISQYVDTVFVVDDGSTDSTAFVAAAAGAKVISFGTNQGKGTALKRGLEIALEEKELQAIILIDGDGQHRPSEVTQVVEPILRGTADMVVGSRFLEVKSEIPWWRQIGQHGLTWMTNWSSGVTLTDSQSGFRALSPRAARLLTYQHSNGFSVESEMQFIINEYELRVEEVPITCIYAEPAKRNPIAHGLQVVEGILRLFGQTRPMLFLGVPAFLLLLAGVLMGNSVINIFNTTHQLAVGHALITVLLITLGTICLSTGIILHSVRSLLLRFIRNT